MTRSTNTQSKSITHKLPPVWVSAAVDAAAMTWLLLVLPRAVVVVLAVARDAAAAAAAAVASWGPKFLRLATMRRSYFLMASPPWIPSKTVCP